MKKYRFLNGFIDFITLIVGSFLFIAGLSGSISQENGEFAIAAGYGGALIALFFLIRNWRKQKE
jgi:hypothetical protein